MSRLSRYFNLLTYRFQTDVSGTCNYTYSVHSGSIGNSARQSGGVYHVRKVNDFSTCTHRPRMAYTALEVTDCDGCDKVGDIN